MAKPHVVLVHGSYHRAWHLKFLQTELENAGYAVSVPELPSIGADEAIPSGMSADAEVIRATIENAASASESIMPVFHSYAGIPGSEAAVQLSDATKKKVQRLVYLAALVVPEGTSCLGPGSAPAPWGAQTEDGNLRYVPDPVPPLYHDVEPELAKEAAARCVTQCMSALVEKTRFTGWKEFPTTYIFCDDDRAVIPAMQQKFFDKMDEQDRKKWEFETSQGSHSPFLAKPAECAKMIRKIAREEV